MNFKQLQEKAKAIQEILKVIAIIFGLYMAWDNYNQQQQTQKDLKEEFDFFAKQIEELKK